MSDLNFVPKDELRLAESGSEGVVPAGSIPIGGGEAYETARDSSAFESYQTGVERYISWRGDGAPQETIVRKTRGRPKGSKNKAKDES